MQLTEHKMRSVFERYDIVRKNDLHDQLPFHQLNRFESP